jgi:hypothetical protein
MSNNSLTIITNRRNAQHSTGPRTDSGKRTASLNSLCHGLTGNFVLLPTEDPEAYRLFTKNLHADLQPDGALEAQLAQTVSDTQWRLNRIQSLEASLFTTEDDEDPLDRQLLRLQLLGLYEQRLTRILQSTLKQLRIIQKDRCAQTKAEFSVAGKIRQLLTENGLSFHPQEFGFVCSPSQLASAFRREEALHGPFLNPNGFYTPSSAGPRPVL